MSSIRQVQSFDNLVLSLFPELNRAAIGFEPTLRRLFDLNQTALAGTNYPPYNIIQLDKDRFQIELAVAGFSQDEIHITLDENELSIQALKKTEEANEEDSKYVHRGLAARSFVRKFTLGDYVEVESVELVNGLLTVSLVREIPEAKKPKSLEIGYSRSSDAPIQVTPINKKIAAA